MEEADKSKKEAFKEIGDIGMSNDDVAQKNLFII